MGRKQIQQQTRKPSTAAQHCILAVLNDMTGHSWSPDLVPGRGAPAEPTSRLAEQCSCQALLGSRGSLPRLPCRTGLPLQPLPAHPRFPLSLDRMSISSCWALVLPGRPAHILAGSSGHTRTTCKTPRLKAHVSRSTACLFGEAVLAQVAAQERQIRRHRLHGKHARRPPAAAALARPQREQACARRKQKGDVSLISRDNRPARSATSLAIRAVSSVQLLGRQHLHHSPMAIAGGYPMPHI